MLALDTLTREFALQPIQSMDKLYFITLLLLCEAGADPNALKPRQALTTCTPKIKFKLCNADSSANNPMWNMHNSLRHTFELLITPGCKLSEFRITWTLLDKSSGAVKATFPKFEDRAVLKLERYAIDFGQYILKADVDESAELMITGSTTAQCWIRAVTRLPVPYLKGGSIRNVITGSTVTFDATRTIESGKKLKYSWHCHCTTASKECNNMEKAKGKVIKLKITAKTGMFYNITLTVSAPGITKSVVQALRVVDESVPILEIQCVKNCMEDGRLYSDPKVPLFVKVICFSSCDRVKSYYWDINSKNSKNLGSFIISSGTEYGRKDEKLIIQSDMMSYSASYQLFVDAKDAEDNVMTIAELEIKTTANAGNLVKCNVNPSEGWSLKTDFKIKCNVPDHPRPLSYHIKQPDKNGTTIAFSSIPEFTLKLSAEQDGEQQLQIVVMDDTMTFTGQILKVKVKSFLSSIPSEKEKLQEIKDVYNGKRLGADSVISMLKLGKTEDALQVVNGLLTELKRLGATEDVSKFTMNLQTDIMNDLHENMGTSSDELEAIITLLPKLSAKDDKPKNVMHASFKARLCKKLAEGVETNLKATEYPFTYYTSVREYNKFLQTCAEDILDNKFEKPFGFDITSPPPIENHLVFSEDYPNYKDVLDESTKEGYREMMDNSLQTLKSIGHAYSRTIALGEPPVKEGTKSEMGINIDYADFIAKQTFESTGVSVKLPADLGVAKQEEIRIVFTTINKDAFFWDDSAKTISTKVIDLNVYGANDNIISEVPNPIDCYFDSDSSTIEFSVGEATVPKLSDNWVPKIMDFYLRVYRLDMENGSSVLAVFEEIAPVKEILVLVQKSKRPSLNDFGKAKIIRNGESVLVPTVHEDCWYYIAVLPKKEDVTTRDSNVNRKKRSNEGNITVTYKYGFVGQKCLEWKDRKWNVANCVVGKNTNRSKIHCVCRTVTALAAQMLPTPNKLDPIKILNFELQPVTSYVVYATTLLVFFVYCLALCCIIIRKKAGINLYFLSDNLKDERYAYLISVQTGTYHLSGTTSNVTVKLYGDKNESMAHVLNYPDPDKNILQKGREDLFILTTEKHLGEITRMQIWFDCIGFRPTWFCETVKVVDLQTNGKWHFNVHKWFTMIKDDMHHYNLKPKTGRENFDKKNLYQSIGFHFNAKHTWNIFDASNDLLFPYTERLTVVLSHIFCTYALTLWICCNPTMRLADSLGRNYFSEYQYLIGYSLLVAFLAFLPNIAFTMLFRLSQRSYLFSQMHKERMPLPERTRIITWALLILTIVMTSTYLIAFGFWIALIPSLSWLTVTTIALLINAVILENVFHILFNTSFKILRKGEENAATYDFKAIVEETERQRKFLYSSLGNYALRPYLRHLYKPLSGAKLIERKRKAMTRFKIRKTFRDMMFFFLYIFFLFVLLYINMDEMSFVSNDHMDDMLEYSRFTGTIKMSEVRNLDDIYNFVNHTIIGALHPRKWYGTWSVEDPGLMVDFNTKVLGVARIRQKKVRKNSCAVTPFMRVLEITECNPDYATRYEDETRRDEDESMWTFQSVSKSETFYVILGELHAYSGSGFIAKLGRNLNNAYFTVQMLKDQNWLNSQTRLVVIEFLAYNANQNLFTAVTITFEKSGTNIIILDSSIFTERLNLRQDKSQVILIICFTIFVMLIIAEVVKHLTRVVMLGGKYLLNFWNLLEITIVIMNVAVIILFIVESWEFEVLLTSLATQKQTEFFRYFHMLYLHNIISILIAILIFIGILRLWSFLRFMMIFRVFEQTVIFAFWPLVAAIFQSFMIMLMFGLSGYTLFCFFSPNYRNIQRTVVTLMQLCLNMAPTFDFRVLTMYFPTTGVVYYCLFLCFMFSSLNLYIIIVNMYYQKSKNFLSKLVLPYSVVDYIKDECKYMWEILRRKSFGKRQRAGEDYVLPGNELVSSKSPEERYANSTVMTDKKLQTMALIARGVIRNLYYVKKEDALSETEVDLMNDVILNTVENTGEKITSRTIFLKRKGIAQHKVTFITDNKLLQMEYIVKRLLEMPKDMFEVADEMVTIKDTTTLKRIEIIESGLDSANRIIGNISLTLRRKRKSRNH